MTTIQVSGAFTVANGQNFSATDETVFFFVPPPALNFTNDGTISMIVDNGPQAYAAIIQNDGSFYGRGYFLNAFDGLINVTSVDANSSVEAIRFDRWAPDILNDGTIQVTSAGLAGGVVCDDNTSNNTGTILISGDQASGIAFPRDARAPGGGTGSFSNSGSIQVTGVHGAGGVSFGAAPTVFQNQGSIVVLDSSSHGLGLSLDNIGRPASITNSGTISADIAISAFASSGIQILNSGAIDGKIDLTNNLDVCTINNTGSISGDVILGLENDIFNGAGGIYTGTIVGGPGNDFLTMGAGGATLTGGTGNDTFVFAPGNGADVITDFAAGGTDDSIDLSAYTHIGSFEQVLAHAVQAGPDTILRLGDEDLITLSGVSKSALTAADFTLSLAGSPGFASGADFTGDGAADVLWRDDTGLLALWTFLPGGAISYSAITTFNQPSWHIYGAADFTDNGQTDILWRNDNGEVGLWQPGNANYVYRTLGHVGLNWHIQATGDFNGDGAADILWRDDTGFTAMWASDFPTDSAFTYVGIAQVGLTWHVQGAGDFNGDGLADVLWRDDTGLVALWEANPGSSQMTYVPLNSAGLDWSIVGTGDFNGDGKADILWRQDTGRMGLWESGPSALAVTYMDLGMAGLDWHIQAVGDFNHDGKADILWRNDDGHVATWDSGPGGLAYHEAAAVGTNWSIV